MVVLKCLGREGRREGMREGWWKEKRREGKGGRKKGDSGCVYNYVREAVYIRSLPR